MAHNQRLQVHNGSIEGAVAVTDDGYRVYTGISKSSIGRVCQFTKDIRNGWRKDYVIRWLFLKTHGWSVCIERKP